MFEATSSGPPSGCAVDDEAAFDWVSIERELRHGVEQTFGNIHPSGFLALEMDTDTRYPDRLSDAELIDVMVGFEKLAGWAQARQARILAEFARRRPGDDTTMVNTDKPCTMSRFAPDEVGLALTQARMTAKARIGRSVQLEQVLPETLQAWQQGRLDERRVTAICDTTHYLDTDKAARSSSGYSNAPRSRPSPNSKPHSSGQCCRSTPTAPPNATRPPAANAVWSWARSRKAWPRCGPC